LDRDVADDVAAELGNPRLTLAGTTEEAFGCAIWRPAEGVLRLSLLPGENAKQRRYIDVASDPG